MNNSTLYHFDIFRELETQLNICTTEKILIQNQFLDKQASCVCNNISVENQNNLRSDFEKSEKTVGKEIIKTTKVQDSLSPKQDNSCIIIEPVSKLLH